MGDWRFFRFKTSLLSITRVLDSSLLLPLLAPYDGGYTSLMLPGRFSELKVKFGGLPYLPLPPTATSLTLAALIFLIC